MTRGKTVLLVEADYFLRDIMRSFLELLHCRVLEAENVKDALCLAQARQLPIEVVIVDLDSGPSQGIRLAEHLLLTRTETQVLFTSEFYPKPNFRHWLAFLNAGFLAKPFALVSLEEELDAVLASNPDNLENGLQTHQAQSWNTAEEMAGAAFRTLSRWSRTE